MNKTQQLRAAEYLCQKRYRLFLCRSSTASSHMLQDLAICTTRRCELLQADRRLPHNSAEHVIANTSEKKTAVNLRCAQTLRLNIARPQISNTPKAWEKRFCALEDPGPRAPLRSEPLRAGGSSPIYFFSKHQQGSTAKSGPKYKPTAK